MPNTTVLLNAKDTEVIIVGAGPTGLMAAALLTRCGVSVKILDKTEQQAHESRAFGVHAKSLELFLNMGLADEFLDRGLIAAGAQAFVNGRQVAELNFDDIGRTDTPYPFLLMVPQWDIEDILVNDLKQHGIQVEHNMEVTGLEQSNDSVTITAKGKDGTLRSIRGSYLIGADGAHSIVRKTLGLSFEGAPYPQGFLLADCKIHWPYDYDHMKIFLRERELAVYLPLRGKEIGRIIAVKPFSKAASEATQEASGSEPATLEEVQAAIREASGQDITLSDPQWVSHYRIHHRGVNKYREQRVFVAGDAAHIHSPAGGQGMNTGIQDAANLAWKLALALKGHASDILLDTYHSERWPIGQKILNYTDKLFAGMSSQKLWAAKLRNFLVPLFAGIITRIKPCRARLFHFISQLGIRYHDNYFLYDAPSSQKRPKHLTAGHRAPNGNIARDCDVFSLAAGYCFHLLVLSRKPLSRHDIDNLMKELHEIPTFIGLNIKIHVIAQSLMGRDKHIIRAESSQVFEVYGLTRNKPQALFLIRPDGYIAFESDHFDFEELRRFIQRYT
jgi:2-polyprenyl-6-methoxyphenol hydroxylase-like FAD-dependent oxidoreductase